MEEEIRIEDERIEAEMKDKGPFDELSDVDTSRPDLGFFSDPRDDLEANLLRNEELAKSFHEVPIEGPTDLNSVSFDDFGQIPIGDSSKLFGQKGKEDMFKQPFAKSTEKSLQEAEEWKHRYFAILDILQTFRND